MSTSLHVITQPSPPFSIAGGLGRVHQVLAASDNLCWLIEYKSGYVAVVDGPYISSVLDYCEAHQLTLTHILNTHTHGDHIGINRDAKRRGLLQSLEVWGAGKTADQIPGLTRGLQEGDQVQLGALTGEVWLTEGHLDGHISFVFDGALFCGDTLFCGGCGYLFDGPAEVMYESLLRFSTLPEETYVCCAHEYTQDNLHFALSVDPNNQDLKRRARDVLIRRSRGESTVPSRIGDELKTNPFLPNLSSAERSYSAEHFAATRALKDRKRYRETPIEHWL